MYGHTVFAVLMLELAVDLAAARHRGQVVGDDRQQLEDGPHLGLVLVAHLGVDGQVGDEARDLGAVGRQEGVESQLGRLAVADQRLQVGVGVAKLARE